MRPAIKRRPLGKTGLQVTELSFGAMNLRLMNSIAESAELVNYVLDQGINLIDTARAYQGVNKSGETVESEVVVGSVLRDRTDLTEPIVVVTKGHAYTLAGLEEDLSTSLNKLGITGRGDLRIGSTPVKLVYLFHGINGERWATMKQSGVLDRATNLKAQGVVSYIGFSAHYPNRKEIKEALDTGLFDVIELTYNVFNRSLGEDSELDLLAYAHAKQVGVINMKAFNGNGMPAIFNIIKDYVHIDYPAMLNFCLSNPYITTVDAGARTIAEFEQDIATALAPRFTPDQLAALKREADTVSPHMRHLCRECMHCLEKFSCPQGVDFPALLSLYSRYTIATRMGHDGAEYVAQWRKVAENAEACIECGECLPWCEYKLQVPELIKTAREKLGA